MKYSMLLIVSLIVASCNSHKEVKEHTHEGSESHSHTSKGKVVNYFESYTLKDDDYGTSTSVKVSLGTRTMITNALPNHETGTFPRKGNPNTISAQDRTYSFPVNPKYTGNPKWIREPGVALNGVKFEPGTAEIVACDTGENYRVEAFQDVIDLGLDFNHAHVQPTGAYHYHGKPTSVIENFDTGDDLVHIGFAHDGFPIYYSKSDAYKPSYKLVDGNREGEDCTYDNPKQSIDVSVGGHHDGMFTTDFEYVQEFGDLDECNGITIEGKYMYLVTNEFPYVSRCLMGEFKEDERRGPPRKQGGRPKIEELFKEMDENKDDKLSENEVRGPLQQDFSKIDRNKDGFITKEELKKTSKSRRPGERQRQ